MSKKLLTVFGGQRHFWELMNSGFVFAGGIQPATWVGTSQFYVVNGERTYINASGAHAIRQNGTITRASVKIEKDAALVSLRFSIWRPVSVGTYRLIASSSNYLAAQLSTGTNTFEVSLTCQIGDRLGVTYVASDSANVPFQHTTTDSPGVIFKDGVLSGDVGAWSTVPGITDVAVMQQTCECNPPAMTVIGDSIAVGGYYWDTHGETAGALDGLDPLTYDVTYDQAHQVASRLSVNGITYQNHAVGGNTLDDVVANDLAEALATYPSVIWLHCGLNDIRESRSLEDFTSELDSIKASVDGLSQPCTLVISEILPYTGGDDTVAETIRTWNAALAAWAHANSAYFVPCHNAMGQTRISTGYPDDLLAAYSHADEIHLNESGIIAFGGIVAARLRSVP